LNRNVLSYAMGAGGAAASWQARRPGRSAAENPLFFERCSGLSHRRGLERPLPERFGSWNSLFRRFRRWALKGVLECVFKGLSGDPDFEYTIIDGNIVRLPQHGAGARGGLKNRPLHPHPEPVEGRVAV